MPMEKWDKCAFAVDEDELEGRVCYGGLDLSSTTDITAFVLVFPPSLGGAVSVPHFGDGFATSCCPPLDEEDKYIILPYFWIPEDNLTLRVNRDHVPYDCGNVRATCRPPRKLTEQSLLLWLLTALSAAGMTVGRVCMTKEGCYYCKSAFKCIAFCKQMWYNNKNR